MELKRARGPVEVAIEVDIGGERHTFLARLSDSPLSAAEARAVAQQAKVTRPVANTTDGQTLAQRLQSTVSYIRSQTPMATGGNGTLIDVQTQGSQLLFVVKFDQTFVPADGKVKLHEVCASELLAPLLQEGATLHATYLGRNSVRIGAEDIYPANCGFR